MSTIFNHGVPPTNSASFTGVTGNDFVAQHNGNITGIWWYQSVTGGPANVTVGLFNSVSHALLVTAVSGALVAGSWNFVPFAAPVAIVPGIVYTCAAACPGGNITWTPGLTSTNHLQNGSLTTFHESGRTVAGAFAYPSNFFSDSYGVDVEYVQVADCPDCPDCPDVVPCSVVLTEDDHSYTISLALLDCVYNAVDHTGDLAIKRRCVVPGEIAWDNCQCGQLAISEVRRYPSREFPLEEIDHSAECGEPYLVVELVVSLTRCIPTVDANGNPPTCDALNTAARQLTRDKRLIRSAVMCCLTEIYDAPGSVLMGFEIGQHLSVGPAGLCGGSELTVLLGFANPCGC